MPRLAWLTDIHLNFVQPRHGVDTFLATVLAARPDGVLISGDISQANDLLPYLEKIEDVLRLPVYFVLGNHDFYLGSIAAVRNQVGQLCLRRPNLKYLTHLREPVALSPEVGLIGHDGWADGRAGDYDRSPVLLNDYLLIGELSRITKVERKERLRELAQEAADHIRRALPLALQQFGQVLLMTHVPPFQDACYHQGQPQDGDWSPHFCNVTMGEAIVEIMRDHPQRQLTALCGHTHCRWEFRPLPNVAVLVGGAEYGQPAIERVFDGTPH